MHTHTYRYIFPVTHVLGAKTLHNVDKRYTPRHNFHLQTVTDKITVLLYMFTHRGKSRVD